MVSKQTACIKLQQWKPMVIKYRYNSLNLGKELFITSAKQNLKRHTHNYQHHNLYFIIPQKKFFQQVAITVNGT